MSENEEIQTINDPEEQLEQPEANYEAALEEVAKLKDQLMYLAADSDNFRKRSVKQIEDAGKFAVNKFAKDLIEVLENLYLATGNVPAELLKENEVVNSIFQGVEMTKITMLNAFARHGISRIFPEVGEMFDHNLHEAVSYVPQPDFIDNSIVSVMRAGYLLHDRLLKPAIVVLAKNA
jgi:molecular chaperone GrpE